MSAETMTVQEVWLAAGGNPGIVATKQDVLDTLKLMDEALDAQRATLHTEQIADLAARCSVKGSAAALAEFAALVREAEPMAPDEMRPAPVAVPVEDEHPGIIGYVEPGHFEELRKNPREGCYMKVYAVPFSAASRRPTVPLYGSADALGAEYLSKRLARVATLTGVRMPERFTHEQIAEVAPTILGEIARNLERAAALQTELVSALRQARDALLDHGDERVVAPAVDRVEGVLAKAGAM